MNAIPTFIRCRPANRHLAPSHPLDLFHCLLFCWPTSAHSLPPHPSSLAVLFLFLFVRCRSPVLSVRHSVVHERCECRDIELISTQQAKVTKLPMPIDGHFLQIRNFKHLMTCTRFSNDDDRICCRKGSFIAIASQVSGKPKKNLFSLRKDSDDFHNVVALPILTSLSTRTGTFHMEARRWPYFAVTSWYWQFVLMLRG